MNLGQFALFQTIDLQRLFVSLLQKLIENPCDYLIERPPSLITIPKRKKTIIGILNVVLR